MTVAVVSARQRSWPCIALSRSYHRRYIKRLVGSAFAKLRLTHHEDKTCDKRTPAGNAGCAACIPLPSLIGQRHNVILICCMVNLFFYCRVKSFFMYARIVY